MDYYVLREKEDEFDQDAVFHDIKESLNNGFILCGRTHGIFLVWK